MPQAGKIDFVEFPARDLGEARRFYGDAFGWRFHGHGDEYAAVAGDGPASGFQASAMDAPSAPLVLIYADDLEDIAARVTTAGGTITRKIYAFPGGRRFHFRDPNGNELGVWSRDLKDTIPVLAPAKARRILPPLRNGGAGLAGRVREASRTRAA